MHGKCSIFKCFISYSVIIHDNIFLCSSVFFHKSILCNCLPFPLICLLFFFHKHSSYVCVHSSLLYFVCLSSLGLPIGHLFCFFIFEVLKWIISLFTLNTCHASVFPIGFLLSDFARCLVFLIFTLCISFVMFMLINTLYFFCMAIWNTSKHDVWLQQDMHLCQRRKFIHQLSLSRFVTNFEMKTQYF